MGGTRKPRHEAVNQKFEVFLFIDIEIFALESCQAVVENEIL